MYNGDFTMQLPTWHAMHMTGGRIVNMPCIIFVLKVLQWKKKQNTHWDRPDKILYDTITWHDFVILFGYALTVSGL